MKKTFTIILLIFSLQSFAQDSISYKAHRSVWSIIPRFGVGDKQTRSNFTTYGSVGLRREFALFSLLSLNAVASYNSAYGRDGHPNLNVFNIGGGLTVYPFGILKKINKIVYGHEQNVKNNYRDFYIDFSGEANFNDSKYGYAGDIGGLRVEVSVGRYNLSKAIFVAPKLGFNMIGFSEPQLGGNRPNPFNFYYLGAGFGFNPKQKHKR